MVIKLLSSDWVISSLQQHCYQRKLTPIFCVKHSPEQPRYKIIPNLESILLHSIHHYPLNMMVQTTKFEDHLQASTCSIQIPTIKLDIYPIANMLEELLDFSWVTTCVSFSIPRRHVKSRLFHPTLNSMQWMNTTDFWQWICGTQKNWASQN